MLTLLVVRSVRGDCVQKMAAAACSPDGHDWEFSFWKKCKAKPSTSGRLPREQRKCRQPGCPKSQFKCPCKASFWHDAGNIAAHERNCDAYKEAVDEEDTLDELEPMWTTDDIAQRVAVLERKAEAAEPVAQRLAALETNVLSRLDQLEAHQNMPKGFIQGTELNRKLARHQGDCVPSPTVCGRCSRRRFHHHRHRPTATTTTITTTAACVYFFGSLQVTARRISNETFKGRGPAVGMLSSCTGATTIW